MAGKSSSLLVLLTLIMAAISRPDVRLGFVGNVDSGKSTLIGVLSKGQQDDGRGLARGFVLTHPHEKSNGRTSAIAFEMMCFREDGEQILPERVTEGRNKAWKGMIGDAAKVVTFVDLCGHEKYQRTTVFGFLGAMLDYALIVVGANMGVSRMTREHIGLSLMAKVPIIVVVTKVDIAPEEVYQRTLSDLQTILRSPKAGSQNVSLVAPVDDMPQLALQVSSGVLPIFSISNVTGQGLAQLKELMRLLPSRNRSNPEEPLLFRYMKNYKVNGSGLVVEGVLESGTVTAGGNYQLGPDSTGQFKPVQVKSIEFMHTSVPSAVAGQTCSLAVRTSLTQHDLRKGMLIAAESLRFVPSWSFDVDLNLVSHPTTMRAKYECVAHIGTIRQCVRTETVDPASLPPGKKGSALFTFTRNAEVVRPGESLVIREGGRIRGIGTVLQAYKEKKKAPAKS